MDGIRNEYFLWLLKRVDVGYVNIRRYVNLLEYLYEYDYTWVLPLDGNLASNGLDLRYEFNPDMDLGVKPCSVLEMLVSLSWSWDRDITYDYSEGDRSGLWFWVMVENLGLLECPDDEYEIDKKLDIWLNRKFDYDGKGSPFPLDDPKRDQRKIIIWLQVNDFVMEKIEI